MQGWIKDTGNIEKKIILNKEVQNRMAYKIAKNPKTRRHIVYKLDKKRRSRIVGGGFRTRKKARDFIKRRK